MRVAFGLKARTGRAALVAVAGDAHEPQGRSAGPPWGKDQKEAAAAALGRARRGGLA
ncbi:MAG TPA: hypothetical protein VH867_01150 [Burkholderiales bacterium]|jgi:hypothetical protein